MHGVAWKEDHLETELDLAQSFGSADIYEIILEHEGAHLEKGTCTAVGK